MLLNHDARSGALVHDQVDTIGQDLCNLGCKAIAPLGHRLNEALAVLVVAQGLAQLRDVDREVSLLNIAIGPEPLHQAFFVHHVPGVLYEHQKRLEHLGFERHRLAVAQ